MAKDRVGWREEGVLEGAAVRTIFALLFAAAASILVLDLRQLIEQASDDEVTQTMRVVLAPPVPDDQERPYFPRALPVLPGSDSPLMPGLDGRPTPEMTGGRMTFRSSPAGDASAIGRIEP